jgi:hypothetical protein
MQNVPVPVHLDCAMFANRRGHYQEPLQPRVEVSGPSEDRPSGNSTLLLWDDFVVTVELQG